MSPAHGLLDHGIHQAVLRLSSGQIQGFRSPVVGVLVRFFQRIAAQPSGLITEYQACSSIATRSPTPMPRAPEPPSPITMQTIGVRPAHLQRVRAIASACPLFAYRGRPRACRSA